MEGDYKTLLFYSSVRWLLKGNTINRFFDLREEMELFLDQQKKSEFAAKLKMMNG